MPLVLPPNFSPILNPCLRRPARVLRRRSPDGTGSVDSILAMLKTMDFLASFRNSWRCALLNSCFVCTLVYLHPGAEQTVSPAAAQPTGPVPAFDSSYITLPTPNRRLGTRTPDRPVWLTARAVALGGHTENKGDGVVAIVL